ncbi:hypothetical protein LB505_009345 [Fusarium chuoi]|nr:hypothetical protein LB505_009345 [Fusarium chuoi]
MTFIRRVIEDPNHLGLDSLEDASYLGMMLIIGASDTSLSPCFRGPRARAIHPSGYEGIMEMAATCCPWPSPYYHSRYNL